MKRIPEVSSALLKSNDACLRIEVSLCSAAEAMKNAIELAINNLRKSVTCSICLGYFNLPVTLVCSHSYCADCIEPVLRSKRPCPICSSAIKCRSMIKELDIGDMVGRVSAFVDSMDDLCSRTARIPALVPAPEIPVRRTATDLAQHVPSAVSTATRNAKAAIVEVCSGVVPTGSGAVACPSHVVRCFKVGDLVEVAARTFAGKHSDCTFVSMQCILYYTIMFFPFRHE
jgi:hypothetical protein